MSAHAMTVLRSAIHFRHSGWVFAVLLLTACGGGGGDGGSAGSGGDPVITIANASLVEGNSGTASLIFSVSLDKSSDAAVTMDFVTADITAVSDGDYLGTTGNLTISSGATAAEVSVTVNGDTIAEGSEAFAILFSNPANATLGNSLAIGTIVNDDFVSLAATGQSICYDGSGTFRDCAGTGEDGEHQVGVAIPSPRFTVHGDGTATDLLSGLMWPTQAAVMPTRDAGYDQDGTADDGVVSWQRALDYVAKLNNEGYLGYSDWRLPNRLELLSLSAYHVGIASSYYSSQGMSGYGNTFWTSSTGYDDPSAGANAWIVNLTSGYITVSEKNDLLYALPQVVPVRGVTGGPASVLQTGSSTCFDENGSQIGCEGSGQDAEFRAGVTLPSTRFTGNADSSYTDLLTGLIWAPDANLVVNRDVEIDEDGKMTWQAALDYIALLNAQAYLGHSDWRMPNVIEMQSLVHIGDNITNSTGISNIMGIYWTSSTNYSGFDSYAWTTQIGPGILAWGGANPVVSKSPSEHYVWPVRGGL